MPELSGLDVYEGQGNIDWDAVPDLTFVCCKATQWREDRTFRRNWDAMRGRGFPVRAAYHFNTTEPASVQARRMRDVVGELLPGEAPAIDYETDLPKIPILGRREALDLRNAIEDAFGRQAIIYIGYSYPNAAEIIDGRPWWFPSYGISEAGARRQAMTLGLVPHIWQWGGGQHGADVPGVTPGSRDDSNQVLLPGELIAWAGAPRPQVLAATLTRPTSPHKESAMLEMVNHDGREEIVGLSPDGSLVSTWEPAPGAGLGGFVEVLPPSAPKFSGIFRIRDDNGTGRCPDGRLAVRLAGPMGQPWGAWQDGPGCAWKAFPLAELLAMAQS